MFETEHYLGSDITGKWNTFIQNYTHEYDVTIGFTDSSVEILKPSIYKAVNKVNLRLMPGKTIGIVGESGCGKSTTANVMCGLQQATSGQVLFKGQDVTHRTAKERMEIGRVVSVVFQDRPPR